ncbi:MAG: serine dehydratase subunit alpha family protein [Candidatus Cryptobacteroides sp.]
MTSRESEIIGLIHREVKPALGCTEPVAVALAAAKAVELLEDSFPGTNFRSDKSLDIDVSVSGNILKNGMGVGIPGTGMIGLRIAAALGTVCGKASYGLEVLKDLSEDGVLAAKELVAGNKVRIDIEKNSPKLYVKASVTACGHSAGAVIENMHDRIVETMVDGDVNDFRHCHGDYPEQVEDDRDTLDYHLTVKEICEFTDSVAFDDIRFILDDRKLNLALAEEGLKGDYGLKVGKTILSNTEEVFGNDFLTYAMAMTAAASDARMAGCTLPAMSNSGSGNQGITVSMPIIAYALKHGTTDEDLARALILSNLIAIHIKGYLGRLSALCGCVVASTGSSCGLVWLKGGRYNEICSAIKNMTGNITGMVCDGAKVGCAMKVASGVSSSIQSAVLALKGICVCETDGIIDKDIEKTISNLGSIGSSGMEMADSLIQKIMVCK